MGYAARDDLRRAGRGAEPDGHAPERCRHDGHHARAGERRDAHPLRGGPPRHPLPGRAAADPDRDLHGRAHADSADDGTVVPGTAGPALGRLAACPECAGLAAGRSLG